MPNMPVLIATIGAPEWGGVATMTNGIVRYLREAHGSEAACIYGMDRRDRGNATIGRLLTGRWRVAERRDTVNGIECIGIGRRLPSFEVLHYVGNLPEWLDWTRRHERLQVVGGTAHSGFAFAVSGRPFACWVAATLDEDRLGRYDEWPLWRRAVDRMQRPVLRAIENFVLQRATVVMVLSRYTADLIHARYSIPWNRIEIIPYPIDTDLFRPAAGATTDRRVVMVGRFTDGRKNTPLLLRAFARVRRTVGDAELSLVGEAPDRRILRLVADLRLEAAIHFPGTLAHRDTAAVYRSAAVFAFTSAQEGLGIAALEAMACGLPVVSTRCGGPEEFVRDGVNGFLVARRDEAAMADRLVLMLSDPVLRARLGANARKDIEAHYAWVRLRARFADVEARVWGTPTTV